MTDIHSASAAPATSADREIVVTRVVDAPRALVWKVWTEPAHVEAWWGPAGFTSTDCEIDLRVGGAFRLTMRGPDGAVYPCAGIFREIVPPERIVYEGEADEHHPCGAGLPPRAHVTVTFEEDGGKTTVTVHSRFATAAASRAASEVGYSAGWSESVERLAAYVGRMEP